MMMMRQDSGITDGGFSVVSGELSSQDEDLGESTTTTTTTTNETPSSDLFTSNLDTTVNSPAQDCQLRNFDSK